MDDNELCPLCCEELDMSDRQFFPCKCGYQVCMWCWHRIKESESGLCPACRTPYGDDPHEFSAVDMEEVVKANKEKAAAEKREKERLRQQQAAADGLGVGVAGMHIGGGSDGDLALVTAGGTRGFSEAPKDRNQLANMRVIRRNLVYAVGLPPQIATEEILRKPEYFGQYGKISKIVLNRNHNGNGDPRRASASAYVTFAHKEDALASILALDGQYVEGRNIRASYGTSKYCSAFIKNVRCNNPDCTYLHCMGDVEDMFTKQEIQAGYVTSGRDVLAKQQQLAAASGSRRKVGGGGPSGTGKVTSNPVFPPPTYEETNKSQSSLVPPPPSTSSTAQFPPVSSSVQRLSSQPPTISGFSSVAAGGKMVRASSLPIQSTTSNTLQSSSVASVSSHGSSREEVSLTPAEMLSRQQEELRKMHPQNISTSSNIELTMSVSGNGNTSIATPATAASVVAGAHSTNRTMPPPEPHTTLTALTPLKRASSIPEKNKQNILSNDSIVSSKNSNTSVGNYNQPNGSTISNENGSSIDNNAYGNGAFNGAVIGNSISNSNSSLIGSLGSHSINGPNNTNDRLKSDSLSTNNTFFGGQSIGNFDRQENNDVLGSDLFAPSMLSAGGGDQWGFSRQSNSTNGSDPLFGMGDNFGAIGGQGIWGNDTSENTTSPGFSSKNSSNLGSSNGGNMNVSGSSALASMLGIQLPTGVGTLRDSLWESSTPVPPPQNTMKSSAPIPTPIGSGLKKSSDEVILGGGQFQIGGMNTSIGGNQSHTGGGNTSDIKMLQSLLPGVHITSGNAYQPAAPNMHVKRDPNNDDFGGIGWGGFGPTPTNNQNQMSFQQHPSIGVGSLLQRDAQSEQRNDSMWSGGNGTVIGGNKKQQGNDSNIW